MKVVLRSKESDPYYYVRARSSRSGDWTTTEDLEAATVFDLTLDTSALANLKLEPQLPFDGADYSRIDNYELVPVKIRAAIEEVISLSKAAGLNNMSLSEFRKTLVKPSFPTQP